MKLDSFTEKHFKDWLDSTVHYSEQEQVEKNIRELLDSHSDLIEKNYSWSDMRRMCE